MAVHQKTVASGWFQHYHSGLQAGVESAQRTNITTFSFPARHSICCIVVLTQWNVVLTNAGVTKYSVKRNFFLDPTNLLYIYLCKNVSL
jgi:hypothetical protein